MSYGQHISAEQLDHLIRIQDMLRCRMTSVLASDDGFSEGNVYAGVYRALLELKDARALNADLLALAKRMLAAWEGSGPATPLDDICAVIARAENAS